MTLKHEGDPNVWTWQPPRPGEIVPDAPPVDLSRYFASVELGPDDDPPPPPIEVRKRTVALPYSCCAVTDATGVNHCEHPDLSSRFASPPSWWQSLRWRAAARVRAGRLRVGSWVAGVDLDGREGW